ncbi:hypothetical protein ACHAXA_001080 [Cyclostephanos tholiformis]|uniref:Uncharacterized protein n=1 Tax=Cyclostephanos tholiformis TaxID=382380 RepID=A0ABD3R268_9STRA
MAANNATKSIMNALRHMDGQAASSSSQHRPTNASVVQLDVGFKYASGVAPTPSTDDDESGCSSHSNNNNKNNDSGSNTNNDNDNDKMDSIIRYKLSKRSYHLPGNTFVQDLFMYVKNNHSVFGICCHHPLHPVTIRHRLVILMGSLSFGLTVTNVVYLLFLWGVMGENVRHDDVAVSISLDLDGDIVDAITTEKNVRIAISRGMSILWTIGAATHSLFDLALWHMIACANTERRCCRTLGWNAAVSIVMLSVALTTFVALLRAYESGDVSGEVDDAEYIDERDALEGADFRYLYGCLLELGISLFVYTPTIQLVLFSGILGCGVLPVFGGRFYTVREDERRRENAMRRVYSSTGTVEL